MQLADWQQTHTRALAERLAPLRALPDGVLDERVTAMHRIRLVKQASQIHFYFMNADGALDGPMSRIDLDRPLHLIAEYTQAAMLALLWKPEPRYACLLGLAGGRLSLVLFHHFWELTIDNIEIDAGVGPLAEQYFGLGFDRRQRLIVADARTFLAAPGERYDLIVMDAFRDASDDLDELATAEFYDHCKRRLTPGGVVAANMLASDPHFESKIATFGASFRHAHVFEHKHGVVVFGNDYIRLNGGELARRATMLQRRHEFDFPFSERAGELHVLRGKRMSG